MQPLANATVRRVSVGGMAKADLLTLLDVVGVKLNAMAERLFADVRFDTSPQRSLLRTCEISPGDLGFDHGATMDAIRTRASEYGLVPCPLELGPHMRLQYLDQPEGRTHTDEVRNQAPRGAVTVVSAPVSNDESYPCGFYLRKLDGVLWLRGYQSWAGHLWSVDDRLVFVDARVEPRA